MPNKRIIRVWLLFLVISLLSLYSCYSDSTRLDIDDESYLIPVPAKKGSKRMQKYHKGKTVLYSSYDNELFREGNDLYYYSLSIDVFLPDSLEIEGKRLPLSNGLLKRQYMDVWESLYYSNDTTEFTIVDDVKAFLCVNREWTVHSHSKGATSYYYKKPFYGVDGWLIINKVNNAYNVEFDCTVVAEEDGEYFRVCGHNGK